MAELQKCFEEHPSRAAAAFRGALDIRETIYRLPRSVASSSTPANEDLWRLNRELNDPAPCAFLEPAGGAFGWRIEAKPTATGILASVLWSAADLLAGTDSPLR